MRTTPIIALSAALLTIGIARADSLTTTFEGGNGNNGVMFDVTAVKKLTVDSIQFSFSTPGTSIVEIYTKTGTHVGFEGDAGAWTLVSSGSVTATEAKTPLTPLLLALPTEIEAGNKQAFYIRRTAGGNVAYTNGTGTGNLVASDPNLLIYEGQGVSGSFGGTNANRIPNVTIQYTPEVATDTEKPTFKIFGKKQFTTVSPKVKIFGYASDDTEIDRVKAKIKNPDGKKKVKNAKLYSGGLVISKFRVKEGVTKAQYKAIDRDGKKSKKVTVFVTH
ncbi:MAG: hypothetical protein H7A50_11865 [Akkermansiaceae bacterium]|nr:hypothetical protein [Akkermansiaceae bacterium]